MASGSGPVRTLSSSLRSCLPQAQRLAAVSSATRAAHSTEGPKKRASTKRASKAEKAAKSTKPAAKPLPRTIDLEDWKDPETSAGSATKKSMASEFVADSDSPFPHLPSSTEWDACFQKGGGWRFSHHFFLGNKETVNSVVETMDLPKRSKAAGRKLTILEGYPGPGTMTRRFLMDENVERVVSMENHPSFTPWLKSLLNDPSLGQKASQFGLLAESCYDWDTYSQLLDSGMLDHIPTLKAIRENLGQHPPVHDSEDWKADSSLIFFAHLPSTVHGEQLIAQFISAIANRLWQFRYCRMPMYFVCSEHVARRCVAGPGDKLRGKLTALAQALGEPRIIMDSSNFLPHEEHFWPKKAAIGPRLPLTKGGIVTGKLSSGLSKAENCLLLIEPRLQPMVTGVDMDAYEFILRNLFVLRKTGVGKALTHVAPGASSILTKMKAGHPAMASVGAVEINPETPVEDLTITQLVGLAKMFERWPFRPTHLFEEGRFQQYEKQALS